VPNALIAAKRKALERAESLCSNTFQGFCHAGGRDYVKSFAFHCRIHHGANRIIVIHKQDFGVQPVVRGDSYGTALWSG
jgi:hypothetical protein